MSSPIGTPKAALISIGDLLDCCAKVQPGQEVLLLAEIEGLYGGDSAVDRDAIAWIQTAVQARGANASVLWIDEPAKAHAWRIPPVVKAAITGADILINHSFNIVTEEMVEFREFINSNAVSKDFKMVRNFATTAPLLCTAWAQTPYELVSEIRYQTSIAFVPGNSFHLTDPNGTHLEGNIAISEKKAGIPSGHKYTTRRGTGDRYFPWPEWMHPPVQIANANGVYVFESMLSWWSRYIGISPVFNPIELTIKDTHITDIKGGEEAEALKRFLKAMRERVGDNVYLFDMFHFGIHPQAAAGPHQCPNPLVRRIIDHSNSCDLHFHVGSPSPTPDYPYWVHCTADIRKPTLRIGDVLVYDNGYLTSFENPEVLAIAKKYPGRPGLEPMPKSF